MDLQALIARMRAGETLTHAELTSLRAGIIAALDTATPAELGDLTVAAREATTAITAWTAAQTARAEARAALGGVTLATAPTAVAVADRGTDPAAVVTPEAGASTLTLGRALTESEGFQLYRAANGNGNVRLEAPTDVRALFGTTNNVVRPTRIPGYIQQNDQPLTILDVIDRRPIATNSVEWVQETTPPNAATEVAEGAVKPEATFALTLVTDTAATIAHFVNITRQTLHDDLQMQSYVEGRLSYGLMKRLAAQVINGNGTAPNLKGILAQTGLGVYVAGTATEKAIISIRKAKTVAQLSEYEPDSVVLNPVDFEAVELTTDAQGEFAVSPNVQMALSPRIWGLNIVVTTAITGTTFGTTGGTFLVGAFREGVTLWERTGVQLFITDSHASNFTSNILTLLAELRAALSVWRPKSIVKGTFGISRA